MLSADNRPNFFPLKKERTHFSFYIFVAILNSARKYINIRNAYTTIWKVLAYDAIAILSVEFGKVTLPLIESIKYQ